MKYSNYLKPIIKDGGLVNFTAAQQIRILNIGALEFTIRSWITAKEALKNTNEFYRYDLRIEKLRHQLTDQTGNLDPKRLIEEMSYLSQK